MKFEKLVRRDQDLVRCPQCGESHLSPQLSVFSAHANGHKREAEARSCSGGVCPTPDLCGLE